MSNLAYCMPLWLFKTEPGDYSFADLQRDKRTVWSGVTNPQALNYMRQIKSGDCVMIYHTGDERQIVGLAEFVRSAYPDPAADNEKRVVVDIKPLRVLPRPVTLAQIKADPRFSEFALVRISRLSVMPVPRPMWDAVLALAQAGGDT